MKIKEKSNTRFRLHPH